MRKISLFTYLFGSSAFVLALVLLILGFYNSNIFWHFFADNTREELVIQAELIKDIMKEMPEKSSQSLETLLKKIKPQTTSRITIIKSDGNVLADSDESFTAMSNHNDRPEILQALEGSTGSTIRYSSTLKKDMMYVALSIEMENGEKWIIRVSKPLISLEETISKAYMSLLLPFLILFIIAAILLFFFTRYIVGILKTMETGAKTFESGTLSYYIPSSVFKETSRLGTAMNNMAQKLSATLYAEQSEKNKLTSVLSNMDEGIISLDRDDRIIEINNRARYLLDISAENVSGVNIRNYVRNPEVIELLNHSKSDLTPVETECYYGNNRQTVLKIKATPMKNISGITEGMLLVLSDNTNLNRLETIRRDFVSNVSHELKTPITSIKGYIETLRDGAINDAEAAKPFLDIIARQAGRLDSIIDDLLTLSRIESNESVYKLQKEPVDIKTVLESAIGLCSQKATQKNSDVSLQCFDGMIIPVHPRMLELAVMNLIDNAIKYCSDNSVIKVGVETSDAITVIAVTDNGPGISSEHLPRLFERFYRIDKGRSRAMGGTGLGLSIVKHIAQLHGGSVTVESTVGKGSVFKIHLPNR